MPVKTYHGVGSIWFEMEESDGMPLLSIWDDGSVILEASMGKSEFIYPTLEEWEFLAKVVDTNIERLRKESSGD